MSEGPSSFKLEAGAVITVPTGAERYFHAAKSKTPCGDPPMVMPQVVRLQPNGEEFCFPLVKQTSSQGRVLFLPGGVKDGDQLKIIWSDPTCACAQKV
ncbi:MAG: hypothetical protein COY66_04095 [Candidatus Kerfeldbacteria bacterium CG_4_10_14_0_8_um_filter_42_10]|uniref:Uncharacterized protein n=1 Tax=Candidatus Kerfeldbacteria bacterium CG_4_10_14_0_8_um_filter_42_10 TaxID=2014248 RepID=A0A2M7RI61_9BACT|nr:MAG: hypothetical protein COY66_04095 [Candidatus Kerfeldbacteria bacterium CG_4_10_14_0_8_um_filter_42_10]